MYYFGLYTTKPLGDTVHIDHNENGATRVLQQGGSEKETVLSNSLYNTGFRSGIGIY